MSKFEEFHDQRLAESEDVTNKSLQGAGPSDNMATRGSRMDLGDDGHGSENHIAKRKKLVEGDGEREYTMDEKLERKRKRRNPEG